ncbi:MAG: DUF1570 domain-containing protein [Phycisphaera sp.]|nr:MAG: DUF1570 domain-containing protein [Phycisphaera sp.]
MAAWASPQEAFESAHKAEVEGRHREAFDGYLRAWADPALRHEAARRARSLERVARLSSNDDTSVIEPIQTKLGPGFKTYRSRSYLVLSDAPDDWTRGRITLLERAREQYFRDIDRLGVPVHPHPHRLVCVFFGQHGDYLDFAKNHDGFDAGWTAGYYSMAHNAIIVHDDRTSPSLFRVMRELAKYEQRIQELTDQANEANRQGQYERARLIRDAANDLNEHLGEERRRIENEVLRFGVAKVLHEAIHLLAFNTGLQDRRSSYPLWVSEGLAASFEAHNTGGQFGFAFAYEPREQELEKLVLKDELPSLEKVVVFDDNTGLRAYTARPLYAMAYGLFKELHRTQRDELAAYLGELADLPAGEQTPAQHLERFERHFGDVASLERRIARRWTAAARERQNQDERTRQTAGL